MKPILCAMIIGALSACDTGTTGPGETLEPGSLSLRYSGGLPDQLEGGSLSVQGAPRLDGGGRPDAAAWAVAGTHPTEAHLVPAGSKLAVVAFAPGSSGEGALVVLTLPRVSGPATVEIDGGCTEVDCAQGLLLLGVTPREPHQGLDGSCTLTDGAVQITSVDGGRVRGTFSATGRCTRDPRSAPFFDFTVQEGRFDVPISEAFRSGLKIWS